MPEISLLNRQRAKVIDLRSLAQFAYRALPKVDALGRKVLPKEITVVFVSDRRISNIHRRFLRIGGPTDVITFQHGDIIVSVETAHRQAIQFNKELFEELCLYVIHGLLHLAGYDDISDSGYREMKQLQRRLMGEINTEASS
jgi:probable rRNA maturation factor